ncbi:hypothetical protein GA0074692_2570 [Micromonospora pallida]|uniref:Uncharacterized protein n=1 Tax=Micromonospora pallida TaxID=145854 RepID=A0A1C6SH85_9ACTN|nr:hypothetical protein [Micromonospora pallida]SCL28599.1 hypothetical protein GA0074692_2570 [Micromonospora pallida]
MVWRALIGLLWGAVLIAIGVALATDYRGVATKHIELASRVVYPLGPSRRAGWMDERLVRRRARFVVFDRIFGGMVAVSGTVTFLVGGYLLLA